jgi:glycine/D-amino acid oxidase-like deaminating enzyme
LRASKSISTRRSSHDRAATVDNTVDERFVLERHGRVVVGSACSGHGLKFTPVIGAGLSRLADEALAVASGG